MSALSQSNSFEIGKAIVQKMFQIIAEKSNVY